MAILGVLIFHSAMPYVAEWEWHLKNKETSYLLMEFNFWLSRFRMPLLFFISGTVAYFMLQNRGTLSFISLRFRRLFIPLLVGMFLIVPPQVYLERLTQGFQGNYFEFYQKVFEFEPYPSGNFSWHHLWFIFYLFIYDVVFAPLFKWTFSAKGKNFMQKLNWLGKGKNIYLLALPAVILYSSLRLNFPETYDFIHDLCFFFYYSFFLLAGFTCIANTALMNSLEINRRTSLTIAFISIVAINYIRWNGLEPWDTITDFKSDWRTYAYLSLYAITAWLWVMTAIGYGKRYLDKPSKALAYINQAVYPFYILHQTVIIILTYYVIQVTESILAKYLFTVALTFILSISFYHLFIRPYGMVRFLFGMKPKENEKNRKQATTEINKKEIVQPAVQLS